MYRYGVLIAWSHCFWLLFAIELVPIPFESTNYSPKVALGKSLFVDPILSSDGSVSCLSCHNLYSNGADSTSRSRGVGDALGQFNAPTVYNSRYNFRQTWEGRAKDLKEQALIPLTNPKEMNSSISGIVKRLQQDRAYEAWFEELYDDGITIGNVIDALVAFQETLTTPNSKFDRYLRGERDLLSKQERRGYRLFKKRGCVSCHHGINMGGNLYNRFGIYQPSSSKELGRYTITQREEDKYLFKVPSLRNIAKTAPYMHDGSILSLEGAVNLMSEHQLGQPMSKEDVKAIVAFLETLDGDFPKIVKDAK
jgi:cytochrome c peroxidase